MHYMDWVSRFEDYILGLIWGAGYERTFVEELHAKGEMPRAEFGNSEHSGNSSDRSASNGLEKKSRSE